MASFALFALLVLPRCATNGADEIAALQRENARLRGEIEALRGELAGRPAAAAEGASPTQLEQVFVPRSRVSVEVTETANGKTSVASLWYRTVDTGPLPRMEWLQVRAEQSTAGSLTGAWLLIERKAGRGSVETQAARLTIDGRAVELRQASYEATRAAAQTPGRVAAGNEAGARELRPARRHPRAGRHRGERPLRGGRGRVRPQRRAPRGLRGGCGEGRGGAERRRIPLDFAS